MSYLDWLLKEYKTLSIHDLFKREQQARRMNLDYVSNDMKTAIDLVLKTKTLEERMTFINLRKKFDIYYF